MSKKTINQKDQHFMELGKKLKDFYEMNYVSRKQALGFSFLKGLAAGAGAFIGGTLVIALLLWILSFFNELPLIGNFLESIKHTLKK